MRNLVLSFQAFYISLYVMSINSSEIIKIHDNCVVPRK